MPDVCSAVPNTNLIDPISCGSKFDCVLPQIEHPAVQLAWRRAKTGSRPGQRTDGAKLALVVEGGGMRGVISAGSLMMLYELGLRWVKLYSLPRLASSCIAALQQRACDTVSVETSKIPTSLALGAMQSALQMRHQCRLVDLMQHVTSMVHMLIGAQHHQLDTWPVLKRTSLALSEVTSLSVSIEAGVVNATSP